MKKVLVLVSILSLSMFNNSFATGSENVKKKLEEVVKFDYNSLPIQKNQTAFVKVSFKVNSLGKIEVLATNYSDENLKGELLKKLEKITLENQQNVEEVYNYNFTFKKA